MRSARARGKCTSCQAVIMQQQRNALAVSCFQVQPTSVQALDGAVKAKQTESDEFQAVHPAFPLARVNGLHENQRPTTIPHQAAQSTRRCNEGGLPHIATGTAAGIEDYHITHIYAIEMAMCRYRYGREWYSERAANDDGLPTRGFRP